LNSIRHLKTCTSVAAVLVALASASASSAADRTKLPVFAGGSFAFDSPEASDLIPAFSFARRGRLSAGSGHSGDLPAQEWISSGEYKASWFLNNIDAATAHAMGYTGKGVIVAVVDSGLDVTHSEFADRISPLSRSFAAGTDPDDLRDIVPEEGYANGHGTFDAGIILAARDGKGMVGVAPEATVMALRANFIQTEDGSYPPNLAIRYAAENGAKVLNASMQGIAFSPKFIVDPDGMWVPNPTYAELPNQVIPLGGILDDYETLKAGAAADMVMVFSAGNDFRDQPLHAANPSGHAILPALAPDNHHKGAYSFLLGLDDLNDPGTYLVGDMDDPAWDEEIDFSDLRGSLIAVVALSKDNEIASYSNRCGIAALWCIAAPGGEIPKEGQTPEETYIYSAFPVGTYRYWAGTSMAAPVVSGAATLLREAFPYMTARQIIEVILTTATDMGSPEIYGWGRLNVGRAIKGPIQFGAGSFAQTFDVDTKGYDSTWSNDIRGTGGLIKRGEGNLLLTGANTYAGGTEVLGGILTLEGSLKSNLSVGSKATLRGTGEINARLSVAGNLEPGGFKGGTIGILTVNGDAALLGSSTYRADVIGRSGDHDRLSVSGSTALDGGSLAVNLVDGIAPVGKPIDVLSSGEGVHGTFGKVTSNSVSAFLAPRLVHDADIVSVVFERNGLSFASAARTRNQASVADAADRAGAGNGVHDVLAQGTLGSAAAAYDALSGEIHGSVVSSAYGDASLVSRTLLGRLRQDGPSSAQTGIVPPGFDPRTFALWGEGFGSWGRTRTDGNAGSIDTSTGGFILGAEATLGHGHKVGIAGGFTSTEVDGRSSSATNESVFGAVYGSARWGALNARAGASFSVHDIDVTRDITFAGFRDRATSSYDGTTVQAFGELGYRFDMGKVEVEPFVGASVLRLHTDSFSEEGGVAALVGRGRTYDLATTTLGLRAEARLGVDLPLTVRGMLGWRHAYGDVSPKALMAFSGGAPSFQASGVPVGRDALVAEAGLDWQVSKAVTLGVSYQGQIGNKAQDHALKGSLMVRF